MTPASKTLLSLAAAAAVAVPAASAMAAGGTTVPATPDSVKVVSGYAYFDSFKPSNDKLVRVVVKTKGQLPRRYDGLIRADGALGKHSGGSIGSVGGKATRCYVFSVPLEFGRFIPLGDAHTGAKPKVGGHYAVTISAKDANGDKVSGSKTITLRDRKPGDRSGKPIGC
jgi:hypothetical protein